MDGNTSSGASLLAVNSSVDSFRLYEKPWTFYREAVATLLPHRFAHPWDELLRPHMFFHSKNRRKSKARMENVVIVKYKDRFVRMSSEDYGELGERLGAFGTTRKPKGSAEQKARNVNVLAYHGEHGIEVIHLYTGNLITRLAPLKSKNIYYHDINDDFQIESISPLIGRRMESHAKFDIELAYDCLGVISTGLPVAHHPLFNASICNTEGLFGRLDLVRDFVDGDMRDGGNTEVLSVLELIGSRNTLSKTTHSTVPLVVQLHTVKGKDLVQIERYAVFITDSGLVTCVDPSRHRVAWRSQTESSFYLLRDEQEADAEAGINTKMERNHLAVPFPHLAQYNFYQKNEDSVGYVGGIGRYLRTDPYIIAVGERKMTFLSSRTGRVMRVVELEEPAVAPVIVQDFNGDGINDIIVVTTGGVYGYVMGVRTSSDTITALMSLMVGLLVVLFLVRELNGDEVGEGDILPTTARDVHRIAKKKSGRATD
uniref:Uncharacterized protein TCIL3000_11_16030 n=1 Tax=Trypanosoma congolense (strain IL3000) TaxID=1068625 RepID=G0V370_TRYCI|nr:unnamed protein product [Trypanosoma congolense IL3000]